MQRPPLPAMPGARWDDLVLGMLLIVLGGFRVVLALSENEKFGAEATLAALTTGLGVLVLASAWRRRQP